MIWVDISMLDIELSILVNLAILFLNEDVKFADLLLRLKILQNVFWKPIETISFDNLAYVLPQIPVKMFSMILKLIPMEHIRKESSKTFLNPDHSLLSSVIKKRRV